MIRVYDTEKKKWLSGEFCITSNGDLAEINSLPFGMGKINLLSDSRYTYHNDIDVYDSMGNLIFEGDICRIDVPLDEEDEENEECETLYCFVVYIPERAAYLLFETKYFAYYHFHPDIIKKLSVVGNVLDNPDLIDLHSDSAESEEEE